MVLEEAIVTDYALVRAAVADRPATASSTPSARNFNPAAAMAGRLTIVEAEQVVEVGETRTRRGPPAGHLRATRRRADRRSRPRSKDIEKRTTRRADEEVSA